jgi:hypothetical protein
VKLAKGGFFAISAFDWLFFIAFCGFVGWVAIEGVLWVLSFAWDMLVAHAAKGGGQ